MMPITTLMISQIPDHMDADTFRCEVSNGKRDLWSPCGILGRCSKATVGHLGLRWHLQLLLHASRDLFPQSQGTFTTPHPLLLLLPVCGWYRTIVRSAAEEPSEGWGGRCVFINFEDQAQSIQRNGWRLAHPVLLLGPLSEASFCCRQLPVCA